jgi:hypothetical protein
MDKMPEQMPQPQHREGIQKLMDTAYDEAQQDNEAIDEKEAELRELKGINGKEANNGLNLEKIKTRFSPFITEVYTELYGKEEAEEIEQKIILMSPKDINWHDTKINHERVGEYTLNPDTVNIAWESVLESDVHIIDLDSEDFNMPAIIAGRTSSQRTPGYAAEDISARYGDSYHIPGIEYWKYIIENPDKAPNSLKNGKTYCFVGSILRSAKSPRIPCIRFDGTSFSKTYLYLDQSLGLGINAVLIEK